MSKDIIFPYHTIYTRAELIQVSNMMFTIGTHYSTQKHVKFSKQANLNIKCGKHLLCGVVSAETHEIS